MNPSTYEHIQRGKFHYLLLGVAVLMAALTGAMRSDPRTIFLCVGIAALVVLVSLSFMQLTVRSDGDALDIRFGPLSLLRKRVPFAEIQDARPARSRVLDGWGIHWGPGRGWIWNLWGLDCVELGLTRGRKLRIGTDEPQALAAFLQSRFGAPSSPDVASPGQPSPGDGAHPLAADAEKC